MILIIAQHLSTPLRPLSGCWPQVTTCIKLDLQPVASVVFVARSNNSPGVPPSKARLPSQTLHTSHFPPRVNQLPHFAGVRAQIPTSSPTSIHPAHLPTRCFTYTLFLYFERSTRSIISPTTTATMYTQWDVQYGEHKNRWSYNGIGDHYSKLAAHHSPPCRICIVVPD